MSLSSILVCCHHCPACVGHSHFFPLSLQTFCQENPSCVPLGKRWHLSGASVSSTGVEMVRVVTSDTQLH